jgi:hypothetical protein
VPCLAFFDFWHFAAFRLLAFCSPLRHSLIANFLSGVPARSRLSLLRLIVTFFLLCFLWFPCILFPLFYFVLIFHCILFSLGFYVFTSVFPCIAFLCLFCVFFSFYSFADLLCACFATLRPLLGLFLHLHHVELPTRPSMYGICLHVISVYFPVFLLFICLQ